MTRFVIDPDVALRLTLDGTPALPPQHRLLAPTLLRSQLLSGDCFSVPRYEPRGTSPYQLAVQLIEQKAKPFDATQFQDHYQQALSRTLLLSMIENPSTLTRATHQLWIVHNLERVADRSTNICEQVIFMIEGEWPDLQELPTEVSADEIMPTEAPATALPEPLVAFSARTRRNWRWVLLMPA